MSFFSISANKIRLSFIYDISLFVAFCNLNRIQHVKALTLTLFMSIGLCLKSQNGRFDLSFNSSGSRFFASTDSGLAFQLKQVLVQKDGKTLHIGLMSTNEGAGILTIVAVWRLNVNGSIDKSYGTAGIAKLKVPNYSVVEVRAAQDPDDNLNLAYTSYTSPYYSVIFSRLLPNGKLDLNLNSTGTQKIEIPKTANSFSLSDIVLDKFNKPIVSGYIYDQGMYKGFVLKCNNACKPDSAFGKFGYSYITISNYFNYPVDLTLDSAENIYTIIYTSTSTSQIKCFVFKFLPNGNMDGAFGNGGSITLNTFYTYSSALRLATYSDGSIITAASKNVGGLVVQKWTPLGKPDLSFNDSGVVVTQGFGDFYLVKDIKIQNNNNIWMAGVLRNFSLQQRGAIFCLIKNGSIDTNVSASGLLSGDVDIFTSSSFESLAFLKNGKVIANGSGFTNTATMGFACQYTFTPIVPKVVIDSKDQILVYPNPIESSSVINYRLQNADIISVCIYNLKGKKVLDLYHNFWQTAGLYSKSLAGAEQLTPGTYVLVLQTKNNNRSVKILVQ